MAWRFVRQPNGRLAVFSEITDHFIAYDLAPNEALEYAVERGREECQRKVDRGIADTHRWEEALRIIEFVHGKAKREAIEQEVDP
jgi:hypothetical protein